MRHKKIIQTRVKELHQLMAATLNMATGMPSASVNRNFMRRSRHLYYIFTVYYVMITISYLSAITANRLALFTRLTQTVQQQQQIIRKANYLFLTCFSIAESNKLFCKFLIAYDYHILQTKRVNKYLVI